MARVGMSDKRSSFSHHVREVVRQSASWRWLRFWVPAEGETLRMGRLVFICALVGVTVGVMSIWFFSMIEWVRVYALEGLGHAVGPSPAGEPVLMHPPPVTYTLLDRAWAGGEVWGMYIPSLGVLFAGLIRFLLPGVGALLACLIARRFAPSAAGHGTDTVIAAYHQSATNLPVAVAPVKVMASSLVIGTGGSAGAEGPITQIGAVCGTLVARVLRLSIYERRMLLAAGMAAGIGAIFRAPMAGALFAAEVLYRGFDLEGDVLIPSMVASTISYMTYACAFGWEPVFSTPEAIFNSPLKFLFYAVLAFLIAAGVRFNILFFRQTEIAFRRLMLRPWVKPLIGGLLVGAIGLLFPQILSSGYGYIQETLRENQAVIASPYFGTHLVFILFALGVLKSISTAFTVGSGGSGGMLGPALFSGAMYGASLGVLFGRFFPGLGISVANFAMLGMAGYLTAAVRTPLAAILMVSEFTGNHNLLLPAMWVCGLSFLLTPGWTLYRSQLRDRDSSPVHDHKHGSLSHDVAIRVKRKHHRHGKPHAASNNPHAHD